MPALVQLVDGRRYRRGFTSRSSGREISGELSSSSSYQISFTGKPIHSGLEV